jgi:cysteinyl-tRNA synthetase
MKTFKFFNTLTRQLDNFTPIASPKVLLYTCGPTVYNFAHIGNFRTYVFEDLLRRSLEYFGYDVNHVMNITDVDDKTLKGAIEKNVSLHDFTEPFTKAFFEDLKALHILKAQKTPKATDFINEMIEMIKELIEKGNAYVGPDQSVYFSLKSFPTYGRLSHLDQKELKEGASQRVHADEYDKENPSDFVLWKAYDSARDGHIFWESPFGKGRPGWHIECSAMAASLLGKTIDIHCGGIDNMFPHHENEIAQCEACYHQPFSKIWLHSQHLLVDGKKMSKSLGNFFTLRDLIAKGYSPRAIRFVLLNGHYRMPLNFTMEGLDAAKSSLARIDSFIDRLKTYQGDKNSELGLENFSFEFEKSLLNDLGISEAFSCLFDLIRFVNLKMDQKEMDQQQAQETLKILEQMDKVFGLLFEEKQIPEAIINLAEKRKLAKLNKDFKLADEIRNQINELGYILEDSPTGYRVTSK